MSMIAKKWKTAALLALSCLLVSGIAAAVIPVVGGVWYKTTYYDANGQEIGGRLYDCAGVTSSWGRTSLRSTLTQGNCPNSNE